MRLSPLSVNLYQDVTEYNTGNLKGREWVPECISVEILLEIQI